MNAHTESAKSTVPLHLKSPLMPSHTLSELCGREVLLKMDTIQPSGSYKIRGIGHMIQKVRIPNRYRYFEFLVLFIYG